MVWRLLLAMEVVASPAPRLGLPSLLVVLRPRLGKLGAC
jgi:hypothetical protein